MVLDFNVWQKYYAKVQIRLQKTEIIFFIVDRQKITFDGRYVPLDFTMEIYRINQVYVLKIAEDRKNSRNFFPFMLW